MKYLTSQPEIGRTYRVEHNGEQVYDASIVEHDGGCWAKIRIENILPTDKAKYYSIGQEFDMKLSHYNLLELDADR